MKNQQRKTSGVRWIAALGAVALLAVGAGSAAAGPVEQGAAHGLQAHVDKAGKLRQPTPAEVKALSEAFQAIVGRSAAQGVQVTEYADGSASALLGPEALNVWIVTINEDGSLSQACVEGLNAAAATAAPALEEK